ncbi:hypothetical protein F4778DRAFT_725551 [Xylariomycetidae sp. FL2044]|nr:hypothetical protein F4778DRAFT_725551 [Xylariomycetidae sp. FL2044]
MSFNQELAEFEQYVKQNFDRYGFQRFRFEGRVGRGANGVAWKVRYMPGPSRPDYSIVVKASLRGLGGLPLSGLPDSNLGSQSEMMAYQRSYNDTLALAKERQFLEGLKWAQHIVKLVLPSTDPLMRRILGTKPLYLGTNEYIFMEFLENGSVRNLIYRAREEGIKYLPNQILWRIFLCLIRACVALAYPPGQPDGLDPQPIIEEPQAGQASTLIHADLHEANVMFGPWTLPQAPLPPELEMTEHDIVPILKMIDFGAAMEWPGNNSTQARSVAQNLFDIGEIMIMLATLDPLSTTGMTETEEGNLDQVAVFQAYEGGPDQLTTGVALLPGTARLDIPSPDTTVPVPNLDIDLLSSILLCVAVDESERPRLSDLVELATQAVRERDFDFYQGNIPDSSVETLGYMIELMKTLTLASTTNETHAIFVSS